MLRSTQLSLLRPLAGAGMIAAAAMLVPAVARAQVNSEAAMLNRLAPTVYLPGVLDLSAGSPLAARADAVDGERALLGRTPAPRRSEPALPHDARAPWAPSGAQALLGRPDPPR